MRWLDVSRDDTVEASSNIDDFATKYRSFYQEVADGIWNQEEAETDEPPIVIGTLDQLTTYFSDSECDYSKSVTIDVRSILGNTRTKGDYDEFTFPDDFAKQKGDVEIVWSTRNWTPDFALLFTLPNEINCNMTLTNVAINANPEFSVADGKTVSFNWKIRDFSGVKKSEDGSIHPNREKGPLIFDLSKISLEEGAILDLNIQPSSGSQPFLVTNLDEFKNGEIHTTGINGFFKEPLFDGEISEPPKQGNRYVIKPKP